MTKTDIINGISSETGMQQKDVAVVVEGMMSMIRGAMCDGENVFLRGFGTFIVKRRAPKIARNISKNTSIHVPAHYTPAFKPSKIFAQQMREATQTMASE